MRNNSGRGSAIVRCIVGHNRSLERIQEANPEIEVIALGNLGVGTGSTDRRDLGISRYRKKFKINRYKFRSKMERVSRGLSLNSALYAREKVE